MKIWLSVLLIVGLATAVQAQNVEGQPIAAEFGEYQVQGTTIGGFSFAPSACQVSGGGKNFNAFAPAVPIKIADGNPALTEIVTPSSVFISACSVNVATAYLHVPPFYLTSGTGGLQEALTNAKVRQGGVNTIILNERWYELIQPGNAASVIASVQGSTSWGLVDVTQTPYVYYGWTAGHYVSLGTGSGQTSGAAGGSLSGTYPNPGLAANLALPTGTTAVAPSSNDSSNLVPTTAWVQADLAVNAAPPTYSQGGTGAVTETVTAKLQQSLSIKDFGAVGDGAHMAADSAGLLAAVAAANITGKAVYIPAGNYLLNNASSPALSGSYGVLIYGDGPSSSLTCNTVGGQDCIASTSAVGFRLRDLAISFGPTATIRSSGYALDVQSCSNCAFEGLTLNNGDLSGIRLASSVGVQMHNIKISNFFANGLFSINNQDLRVDGESCYNNQDACFEASWFDSQFGTYGIPCQNITATNITSNQDTEAILINACNNVSVDGFTAINSGKEAVFIGQDPTTTTAHWPDRITISNGTIYGSGYGANANNTSTAPALYFNVGTSPGSFVSHVAISNIAATHVSGWGLQMADLQNDDLQLSNATFYDVGSGGTVGCLQTEGNSVNLDAVACTKSGTYGLYDTNTNRLTGTGLNLNASSQVSGINALYISTTATGFINLTNVSVNDTNTTTFSSEVYDASTVGQHSLWNISTTYLTSTGYLAPTAANPGTTYTYNDPGHSMVYRNGGMIQSFVPPNYYFLPTAGATPTSYVNGAVLYYQSKCWASGAQQTESVGWLDQYPTLSTESFSFNQFGGCGYPITIDMTQAASVLEPQTTVTGTVSGKHLSGMASGTYASVPTFVAGGGAGTGATISPNAQSNDVSGYISVTTASSPMAGATVVTGTFGTPYSTLAKCSIWPANLAALDILGSANVFVPVPTTTAFMIQSGGSALAASTLYTWGYTCIQ